MNEDNNVFLIILRLDLDSKNPLAGPDLSAGGRHGRMTDSGHYSILAGVLDPAHSRTNTPLANIAFGRQHRRNYNWILDSMHEIVEQFDQPGGHVRAPWGLNRNVLAKLDDSIDQIGTKILSLVHDETGDTSCVALGQALDDLLRGRDVVGPHVTVITNDFAIPWYWMRRPGSDTPLCGCRPLGMLQLSGIRDLLGPDAAGGGASEAARGPDNAEPLRALLLGGGGDGLPFLKDELAAVHTAIEGSGTQRKYRKAAFAVDQVFSQDEFFGLCKVRVDYQRRNYRLVHYGGHWGYSGGHLQLDGKPLEIRFLGDFINDSVLALDGCSSSRDLSPWASLKGVTGQMLAHGALGCVVSVLPVRNDPLVSEVFWGAFYQDLLSGASTVGRALLKARQELAKTLESWRLESITPLVYQLVGNPSVRLFAEAAE